MSPLFTYKGKLLQQNGRLANNKNCCCEKCPKPEAYGLVEDPPINFGWTKPPTRAGRSITATFTFEDSAALSGAGGCGTATNPRTQTGIGTCDFTLSENTQATLNVSGKTEEQNAKYDYGWILIEGPGVPTPQIEQDAIGNDKTFHVRIMSTEQNTGCEMSPNPKSDQLQINIGPGTYTVTFQVDTVDGLWHKNMVHNFSVTW
jgi:hypothetical protein